MREAGGRWQQALELPNPLRWWPAPPCGPGGPAPNQALHHPSLRAAVLLCLLCLTAAACTIAPPRPASPDSALVQDFEADVPLARWPEENANELGLTRVWQAQGAQSLALGAGVMASFGALETTDWRGYDVLCFTVNNPTGRTVSLGVEVQDQHTAYHERHQNGVGVPGGVQRVEVDISGPLWRGEENHPYRGLVKTPIDVAQITRLAFTNQGEGTIYIDDVQVARVAGPAVPGAVAFDFGRAGTPVPHGWTGVAQDARYGTGRPFGFVAGEGQSPERAMSYPTAVLGDGLAFPAAGFCVDLPGGAYLGWVAFERGGFWEGEQAACRRAELRANGTVVHAHTYSPNGAHFLFEDLEITDLESLADSLIWPAHAIATFPFRATAGANVFTLHVEGSSGLPLRVAGLALAPATPQGRAWLRALEDGQRQALSRTFAPEDRGRRGQGRRPPSAPLEVRRLAVGETLFPRDWPVAAAPQGPLQIDALAGQTAALHLGVYADRAQVVCVSAAAPAGPQDLPAPRLSHGRYLPMRPYGVGTTWLQVHHYRPEPRFSMGPEVCRALLVEYPVPAQALPGLYLGRVVLAAAGTTADALPETVTVEVALRVVPGRLAQIPVPVGLFMNALPFGPEVVDEETWWRLQESLLAEQLEAGLNCLTGGPGLEYEIRAGHHGPLIVGERALGYVELAQRLGPVRAVVPYGGFLPSLRQIGVAPEALAAALQAFEQEHGLPPHYVYSYDEPGTALEMDAVLAYLLPARGSGLRTIGYTSWHEGDERWWCLATATLAPALNLHQAEHLQRLRQAGLEPWIYNNGLDRLGMGLRLWRSLKLGAAGRLQWIGMITQGFAYHNLDGREPSRSSFLVHRRYGAMPTPDWLAAREGLLDLRLRLTLEQLAPPDDPVLALWTVEGYGQEEAQWSEARLDEVRQRTLARLAELAASAPGPRP